MTNRRTKMMLALLGTTLLGTAAIAAETAAPKAAAPASAAHPGAPKVAAAEAHPGAAPAGEKAAAAQPVAKIDWAKMNTAERKKYMKSTVLPEMKKVFAAFDPKAFANVTCATCHGKDAADKKFKMPSAELPKLPGPTDRAGFVALAEKKPEVVKFMGTQVKPKMAALLGLAEWTPASPTGFACYNCHTHEEGAPAPGAAPAAAPTKPATAPKAETHGW